MKRKLTFKQRNALIASMRTEQHKSLKEIAEVFGISGVRVCQILGEMGLTKTYRELSSLVRTCLECGKEYHPRSFKNRKKFCSIECVFARKTRLRMSDEEKRRRGIMASRKWQQDHKNDPRNAALRKVRKAGVVGKSLYDFNHLLPEGDPRRLEKGDGRVLFILKREKEKRARKQELIKKLRTDKRFAALFDNK